MEPPLDAETKPDLSAEDRRRIYEEEKARIEAEAAIPAQADIPPKGEQPAHSNDYPRTNTDGKDSLAYKVGWYWSKMTTDQRGGLMAIAIAVLIVLGLAIFGIFNHSSPYPSIGNTQYNTPSPVSGASSTSSISTKSTPTYQIFSITDFSVAGRSRIRVRLTSDASTRDDRAAVVMAVARRVQQERQADVVEAIQDLSVGSSGSLAALAIARFAPDGKGMSGYSKTTWEVMSSDSEIEPIEMQMANLWFKNRHLFETRDGFTDERRMKAFIARELKMPASKVTLPFISLSEYMTR
jgi:hypothetical protein